MIGTPQKVLKDLASEITRAETGQVSLSWTTAHGRRVVEVSISSPSEPAGAVRTGSEPVDYVALDLPTNATAAEVREATSSAKPNANPVAQALTDAWRTVFPPKDQR